MNGRAHVRICMLGLGLGGCSVSAQNGSRARMPHTRAPQYFARATYVRTYVRARYYFATVHRAILH